MQQIKTKGATKSQSRSSDVELMLLFHFPYLQDKVICNKLVKIHIKRIIS